MIKADEDGKVWFDNVEVRELALEVKATRATQGKLVARIDLLEGRASGVESYVRTLVKQVRKLETAAAASVAAATKEQPLDTRAYKVASLKGSFYRVTVLAEGNKAVACTCPYWEYRGYMCKHMKAFKPDGLFDLPGYYVEPRQRWRS